MYLYRKGERSVTELLPHQVKLIWENRDSYSWRFILSNAVF